MAYTADMAVELEKRLGVVEAANRLAVERGNNLLAELTAARAENERLRDALEFYADPSTYHAVAFWFDPPCGGFDEDFSEDHGDDFYERPMPGARARAVLRALVGDEATPNEAAS